MVNKTRSVPMVFRVTDFGLDIFVMRNQMQLTCEDVGALVGIHGTTVSKYERGTEANMHMGNFLGLCNLYDLDPRNYFELQ